MFSLIIQEVVYMSTWRIIAILITAWLLYHVVPAVCDPLRSFLGPFMARFTRLWLFRQYCGGNYVWTNIELHKKHGPIVRIAPNQYSLDNPEAAKIIYGHGT
ncbi:uncharacterized protein FFB14_11353 [Fusarium fujikuroi]|nr:uncharacterized protein FFB14_11353 [Fusarium fujikuroi]